MSCANGEATMTGRRERKPSVFTGTAFFVFLVLLVSDVGAQEVIRSTRPGRRDLWLQQGLEPALRALAIKLYLEGDPQSTNVRQNRFETEPGEITIFIGNLINKYSLPDSRWRDFIDEFFYADPGNDRLDNWIDFDSHLQPRVIDWNGRRAIDTAVEGLRRAVLIDDQATRQVIDGFITEDGLYRQGVSEQQRQDFLGYAIDALLDRDEFESVISDVSRVRLELLRDPTATEIPPPPEDWGNPDEKLDCRFGAVLNRMFDLDPYFHLKWNRYFRLPLAGLLTGAGFGARGQGLDTVMQRRLYAGVQTAVELCEKVKAVRELDANGIWQFPSAVMRLTHDHQTIRADYRDFARPTMFEATLDGLSFRGDIPPNEFNRCHAVMEGTFAPDGNTMTFRWFYPDGCGTGEPYYSPDYYTLSRISQ